MINISQNNPPRQEPQAFQSFDATVRDVCAYLGDDEAKTLYIKVSRFLRMALEELNLYLFVKGVKSKLVKINQNQTADLPNDFQTMSKVGICCHDGTIRLIGRNDDLCITPIADTFECCDCSKSLSESETISATSGGSCSCSSCTFHNVEGFNASYFGSRYFNYSLAYTPYLYGYTPKMWQGGSYKLDERNMRIIFSDGCLVQPGQEVIIEYNAAMSDDQYDLVPKKAVPTLMYKTAAMIKSNTNPSASNYDMQQFKIHYRQLKKTYETFTLEDLMAALRGTYKSSPKR